jgi:formylglycine-generating enzyme required for sulfatase activity
MNMRDTNLTADATVATDLFVTVPETTLPNGAVVPAFQVGQYLCSLGADGKAAVTAEGEPFVEADYHTARQACANAGYALITETQALAMAYNASQVAANWSGGAVGEGSLKQGLRYSTNEAKPGTFVSTNSDEDRWFELSNGERVCDVAGNLFTWVFDDVQGDDRGIVARAFTPESPSVSTSPYPSREKGAGWQPSKTADWSGSALIRGGFWYSEGDAGVFRLSFGWPGYRGDFVGFRCTKPVGL